MTVWHPKNILRKVWRNCCIEVLDLVLVTANLKFSLFQCSVMIRDMAVVLMESLQHQGRITLAVPMKIPVRYGIYPVLSSNYYAKLWCFDCLRLITAKLLESTEFVANSYLQTNIRISRHGKKLISMYNITWDTFALCLTVFFFLPAEIDLGLLWGWD